MGFSRFNIMNVKQSNNSKYRLSLVKKATESELIFKKRLEDANINFLFQKGFIKGNFHCIVDFYLPKPHKICIEIDGGYHNTDEQIIKDKNKDAYLISRGFRVIRIYNNYVNAFDLNKLK